MEVSRFDNNYNLLYFGAEIDFRIIPKNCSSTLKVFWSELYNLPYKRFKGDNPHIYLPHPQTEYKRRKRFINANGGMWRDGALKFVIKRDPVERWLSAINFAIQMKEFGQYEEFSELTWTERDINDIVTEQKQNDILLTELYTQTYCAGNVNEYDHVFDIKDFDKCKALMEEMLGDTFPDIYATVSKNKSKWKLSDLTSTSIDDIKVLYAKDYANGWY